MYKIDSPIPFDVGLAPYCEDCDMADLTIDVVTFVNFSNKNYKTRTILCSKRNLCSSLYRHIKNATEKGEDDEIQDYSML